MAKAAPLYEDNRLSRIKCYGVGKPQWMSPHENTGSEEFKGHWLAAWVFQDGSARIWTGNLSDSWLLGHMQHRTSNCWWPESVGNMLVPLWHLHAHVMNTPSPKWRGWVWPAHCLLLISLRSRSRAIQLNTFDKKQTNPLLCEWLSSCALFTISVNL